jgi:hypothetical protein
MSALEDTPIKGASILPDAKLNTIVIKTVCTDCRYDIITTDRSIVMDHGHRTITCPNCDAINWLDARQKSKTTAADICAEAARLVGGDRAVTHGDASINFQNTADIWTAILRAKMRNQGTTGAVDFASYALSALDVANMLEAFKIARRYSGSHNPDDYADGAGYAGCAGEIAAQSSNS